jgi:hypothetical protein
LVSNAGFNPNIFLVYIRRRAVEKRILVESSDTEDRELRRMKEQRRILRKLCIGCKFSFVFTSMSTLM